jgi:hypothetical protein
LFPCWDKPLLFSSDFKTGTVSDFQFLCELSKTAEARLAVCCWIGEPFTAEAATLPVADEEAGAIDD